MSFVIASPEMLVAAASELAGIGSTIGAANAAAAAPTTALVAAAGDEISAAVAALFGGHAQQYQAFSRQAAAFHEQFVHTLTGAGYTLASAEAANASLTGFAAGGAGSLLVESVAQIGQAWINSPLGAAVNPVLNAPFIALTGRGLISNGATGVPGVNGGTGGAGGWLFGNGGTGAAATATTAAGRGGDAGLVGNGGPGGVALASSGAAGGGGGNGGLLMGNGGPGAPGAPSFNPAIAGGPGGLAATPAGLAQAEPAVPAELALPGSSATAG
ncbi:PE family protein [Mycobacterium szulgai]|nr:PE family protein [Mycobacterium szulgai]